MNLKSIQSFVSIVVMYTTIFAVTGCKKENVKPYQTSFVKIGTKPIQTYVGGTGKTTVVLETGLGVDGTTWFANKLFQQLLLNGQVIAYSRAGYESSGYTSGESRGLENLAKDLEQVINNKAANNQVILVGHSLGGSIIRKYAIDHPDKVKAILFVDPNHEKYSVQASMTQTQEDDLVKQLKNERNVGGALEAEQLMENLTILRNLPNLPNVPVILLTAMKLENGQTEANKKDWFNAHETLGRGVANFQHFSFAKNGHFIYLEEPQLIIDKINELRQ